MVILQELKDSLSHWSENTLEIVNVNTYLSINDK